MAAAVLAEAPEHFSVAGHSMGGRVALEMHRAAPERVGRIALLSTSYRPADEGEPAQRENFMKTARREGIAALASAWMPRLLHPEHLVNRDIVDAISRSERKPRKSGMNISAKADNAACCSLHTVLSQSNPGSR
ncbi:MAG: alpha/beta fold hydrolase, partial [Chthoniobacterales bacterium]